MSQRPSVREPLEFLEWIHIAHCRLRVSARSRVKNNCRRKTEPISQSLEIRYTDRMSAGISKYHDIGSFFRHFSILL